MEPSDVEGLIVGKFREVMTVQVLVFSLIAGAMIVWRVDRTRTRPFVLGPIVGWGLLGGLLAVGANLVFGLVLGALGVEIKEQEALAKLLGDRALLISAAPWIVLFVPFAEELLFRGYVFRYLDQQINRTAALFVSCGVFALIHGNLTGIPSYVAVALVFAWVYIKTDSLLAPILAHAVQNGIIVLAAFVTGGTPPP
ncbi:MAG: CPBP family intramembrane metalloprotease [Acidobacteriota bacterium]|nr:CPBP family intramembrane metalloprotease [Acidobacteriota bacterium]MDH3784647.1 CPBP family intramembrane metalloprotease [Acidobacteriota bacterium]